MGQMITHQGELIRINTEKNCIEFSKSSGRTWNKRYGATSVMGIMQDLTDNGNELLLSTSKGLYFSKSKGTTWNKRS